MPLSFWLDHFYILRQKSTNFCGIFLENWRHQKVILRLIDLLDRTIKAYRLFSLRSTYQLNQNVTTFCHWFIHFVRQTVCVKIWLVYKKISSCHILIQLKKWCIDLMKNNLYGLWKAIMTKWRDKLLSRLLTIGLQPTMNCLNCSVVLHSWPF